MTAIFEMSIIVLVVGWLWSWRYPQPSTRSEHMNSRMVETRKHVGKMEDCNEERPASMTNLKLNKSLLFSKWILRIHYCNEKTCFPLDTAFSQNYFHYHGLI